MQHKKPVYGFGIVGDEFPTRSNGKHTKEYDTWKEMLRRCYSDAFHHKHPTYIGCAVCDEWLYFPNFWRWYNQQPHAHEDGYALDKDILFVGNKVYSPQTAILVHQAVNKFILQDKSTPRLLPIGVTYRKKNNAYEANVKYNGIHYLGQFDTPEEAHNAWRIAKLKYAYELVNEYKLPYNVANAIINRYYKEG